MISDQRYLHNFSAGAPIMSNMYLRTGHSVAEHYQASQNPDSELNSCPLCSAGGLVSAASSIGQSRGVVSGV
jgi:hypothetical protein